MNDNNNNNFKKKNYDNYIIKSDDGSVKISLEKTTIQRKWCLFQNKDMSFFRGAKNLLKTILNNKQQGYGRNSKSVKVDAEGISCGNHP